MGRIFSTRRFTIIYALAAALILALGVHLHHSRLLQRQERLIQKRLDEVQQLIGSAYREMPADRFAAWLSRVDLHDWAEEGWNAIWLSPELSVRWALFPSEATAPSPALLQALRAAQNAEGVPVHRMRRSEDGRSHVISILRLASDDPAAELLVLRAPLPRFFADGEDLWTVGAPIFALLLSLFVLYLFLARGNIHRHGAASGLFNRPHIDPVDRKIAEARGQFDALFDLLHDGTLVLDAEDRVVRANATATVMLGTPSQSLVGSHLSELADRAVLENLAGEIRVNRTCQASEIQLHSMSTLCSAAGISLQGDSEARGAHIMIVLRDISRLRQLERASEDYATNVSHELKTPLTLILGHTETLISHVDMEPEFRDRALRTIERHAKRILRIIDDLLRLAWLKNEGYAVGIPRSSVAIGPIIDEAVSTCREWARSAGIGIETRIPDGLVWSLNSGLIEEAIVNLVKNAILYALVGPVEIRVRVLENGNLELAVIDRGPGLKPEDAKRIFDRFYRADKGRSRASGGSGLGLPIVQQIVETHGGTTRVETTPGEGCTFILEIPPGT